MKKLLSTLILLLIFTLSYGQWSTGTGTVYTTTPSDKVGIGTNVPAAPLEVVITNSNTNSALSALILNRKTSGSATNGIGASLDFYAQRGDGSNSVMAGIAGIRTGNGSGTLSHGALVFKTALTSTLGLIEGMRINKDGMVGIGNANPEYILDISNTTNTTDNPTIRAQNALTTGYSQIRLENDLNNTNSLTLFGSTATGPAILGQARAGLASLRSTATLTLGTGTAYPLIIGTNDTEWMRITPEGKVGIGTVTPDAKLAVNGTIHTKEVKVNLTGWSDYVFKPSYKLPTLAQVDAFISQNGHLPGVPSATEVERDGIMLGEMNKLLLKKIEELTLYMLEKEKQVKAQEARIKNLETLVLKKKGR